MSNIKCGSYTGNGSSTGPTVTLGWEPQWVMIKKSSGSSNWVIVDNSRLSDQFIVPNSSAAEATLASGQDVVFTSAGFRPDTTNGSFNDSSETYIYCAIRAEGA